MWPRILVTNFILLAATMCIASDNNGQLIGHLRILSLKEVASADGPPEKPFAKNYSAYPLLVLSEDGKKEVAHFTADEEGNYHIALAPGTYVLDFQRRGHGHVRARPQHFTIVPNQTVTVDFDIDTGVR
jgi:hypothetical protein